MRNFMIAVIVSTFGIVHAQPPFQGHTPYPGQKPNPGLPASQQQPAGMPLPGSQEASQAGPPGMDPRIKLPYPEQVQQIDPSRVRVNRTNEGWVLQFDQTVVRNFNEDLRSAEDLAEAIRTMRSTSWGTIGSPRPIVEYGLYDGQGRPSPPNPKGSLEIDLTSLRAELTRGVWVLRDDGKILLNFGTDRAGAEQSVAVARKYGFNRLAVVGIPRPIISYFYFAPSIVDPTGKVPPIALTAALQEQAMIRTGIPVPGVGFLGERIVIDPRKVRIQKERSEYQLMHDNDVIARLGSNDWTAREALKVIQDARFTEYCTIAGVGFFLLHGAAPTRVPFSVQKTAFLPDRLQVRALDGRWSIMEMGVRELASTPTEAEAQQVLAVIKGFRFDTLCQVGLSPKSSLKFFARTNR